MHRYRMLGVQAYRRDVPVNDRPRGGRPVVPKRGVWVRTQLTMSPGRYDRTSRDSRCRLGRDEIAADRRSGCLE